MSTAKMADAHSSKKANNKPHISCHAPLKPDYLEFEERIVPWETLNFRYKAPPKPAKTPAASSKVKKESKHHKKQARKSNNQKSKQTESSTASTSTGASSTSAVDAAVTSDPDDPGTHISMLPQCCLLRVFHYLPICDLLRAGLACKAWQQLSLDKSLWKSVALEETNILSWTRAVKAFQNHSTMALDFYNIANEEKMAWNNLYYLVKKLPQLQYLRFGYANTSLLSKITRYLPDLKVLEVCWLMDEYSESINNDVTYDLGKLSKLTQLRQLKIRSINSLLQPEMSFAGGLVSLGKLQHLQKLSLTSLQESRISPFEYEFLTKLPELVELELGDCGNWGPETYNMLSTLTNLRCLRLENGGCWCDDDSSMPCTCNIAESLRKLTQLEKLELIMYFMPSDINPVLQSLVRLRTLTFWPMVCMRGHVMGPCAMGCEAPLIQTNPDKCKALGNLQHLSHLTWGVPIITFDSPREEYPYNVTTEKAVKSREVRELTELLGKQLPKTAVNVLIVPVVMSKERYDHPYLDSSDDSSNWDSESDFWNSEDSESEEDFGIPLGY